MVMVMVMVVVGWMSCCCCVCVWLSNTRTKNDCVLILLFWHWALPRFGFLSIWFFSVFAWGYFGFLEGVKKDQSSAAFLESSSQLAVMQAAQNRS